MDSIESIFYVRRGVRIPCFKLVLCGLLLLSNSYSYMSQLYELTFCFSLLLNIFA
jgi:hypothetical protein